MEAKVRECKLVTYLKRQRTINYLIVVVEWRGLGEGISGFCDENGEGKGRIGG